MVKLLRAFRAEQRKLWSKGSLLGCFVLLFVLSFAVSFLCSLVRQSGVDAGEVIDNVHVSQAFEESMNEGWRDKTRELVKDREKQIKELALLIPEAGGIKKAYMEHEMAVLAREQTVAQYRLDNNLSIWDWSGSFSLILCLWLMTPVVAVIAVLYSSDIFAGEFSRGTARVIISRPATRFKIYLAKMLTAVILGVLFMAVAYAASGIGCGVMMDDSSGVYVGVLNGKAYSTPWSKHIFTVFLLCCAEVALSVSLCAALGNTTRSRGLSAACASLLVPAGMLVAPAGVFVGSKAVGVLLPFCIDLTVPFCSVSWAGGVSFAVCALSAGIHFLVFSYLGYFGFRRDI